MSVSGEPMDTAIFENTERNNNNIEDVRCSDSERKDEPEVINENENETNEIPERRLSQASDINVNCNTIDFESNTPIQTDNDEVILCSSDT